MRRYEKTGNKAFDSVLSSIAELDEKKAIIDRQRNAEIEELVLAAAFAERDLEKIITELSKIKPTVGSDVESVNERVTLCKKLVSDFDGSGLYEKYFGQKESLYTKARRVGMLENRYCKLAFERFCERSALQPLIFQSFDEICEAIAGGTCEYGIIPTESSDNGKLLRFYSLIDRYDLKINAVCDTEYSDNTATTRYALVSRMIEYPIKAFGEPDYLELSINLEDPQLLNLIMHAASLCSMRLHRVDSLPIAYKEREFSFCPVFDVVGANIDAFLLYMYLDFPQYTPIGIFSKTENN